MRRLLCTRQLLEQMSSLLCFSACITSSQGQLSALSRGQLLGIQEQDRTHSHSSNFIWIQSLETVQPTMPGRTSMQDLFHQAMEGPLGAQGHDNKSIALVRSRQRVILSYIICVATRSQRP